MPAAIRSVGLLEGGLDLGLAQGGPEPRPVGLAEHADGLAPHRPLGIDPLDRGAGEPLRLGLGDDPPVGLAEQLALEREVDRARRDVHRELCGSRSYSSRAIANGRAMPLPSAPGSPASQRSTVAPASGRPAASSPLTPNRRRIARSWPTVVEARARAPHAPASASARATRRSSGQSDVKRRVIGCRSGLSAAGWTGPGGLPQYGPAPCDVGRPAGHRSTALASRLAARKPRYASTGSSDGETDAPIAEPLGAGDDRRVVGLDAAA